MDIDSGKTDITCQMSDAGCREQGARHGESVRTADKETRSEELMRTEIKGQKTDNGLLTTDN